MERQQPTLFVFDEPTTGLHFHDIKTLLKAFNALIDRGHTLVVIEHNMDVIKCADHIIDLGPEGGKDGGMLICEGTPEEVAACEKSYTGQFLKGKLKKPYICDPFPPAK
ncbi:Excinuclease ABC subunit A [Bacteroidales bacterium Barb7]|nr:Excinuclease ABC subunit A [Bacteroidales bacterium Barb7]